MLIIHTYAHTHHTYTKVLQGQVFWMVSNHEIFIQHEIWIPRKMTSKTYISTSCGPTVTHPFLSTPHYITPPLHTFPFFFQVKCLHFPSLWVVEEAGQGTEVVGREGTPVCHCYCSICILDVVYFRGLIRAAVIQPSNFGGRLSCCWADCSEETLGGQVGIISHF